MPLPRRHFLQLLGGALVGSLITPNWSEAYTGHIPICQHMTNETSAQFSVLTEGAFPYVYQCLDWQGRALPVEIWEHEKRKNYPWAVDKLIVRSLKSGGRYRLRVLSKESGRALDERFFRNARIESRKNLRFALISCSHDFFHFQNRTMWNHVANDQPDMVFLLGDNCYADFAVDGSEFDIWRRYCETRLALNHFRQSFLIPTLAVWDDHDYGRNNANKSYKNKLMAQRCFHMFFGSKDVEGFKNTIGVGSVFSGFGQNFYFMDSRFFRDAPRVGGFIWGENQQEQLLENLRQNSNPSWIFNGGQFFGNYRGEESFQTDYFRNFTDFQRKLAALEAPVLFGSGDVHFSEIMKIEPKILGYKTFELTSSSIHSFNPPFSLLRKNPRRLTGSWKQNFMVVKSEVQETGIHFSTYGTGRAGRNLFYFEGDVIR